MEGRTEFAKESQQKGKSDRKILFMSMNTDPCAKCEERREKRRAKWETEAKRERK